MFTQEPLPQIVETLDCQKSENDCQVVIGITEITKNVTMACESAEITSNVKMARSVGDLSQ